MLTKHSLHKNKTILKNKFNMNWKYWMDSQLLYFKDVFLNTRSLWNKNLAAVPIYYLSRSAWLSCLSIIIWLITSIKNYGHDHEIIIRKVLLNGLNIDVVWFQQFIKLLVCHNNLTEQWKFHINSRDKLSQYTYNTSDSCHAMRYNTRRQNV